jgi:hypothetical protein
MKALTALLLSQTCLLFGACSVGQHHTSDSKLERNFLDHQVEFESLLSELEADEKMTMINTQEAKYGGRVVSGRASSQQMETAGLTKERWAMYQRQLRALGVRQVNKGPQSVEFRVDEGSLLNGDSYKGYEYSPSKPAHPKSRLDGYRMSESDHDDFGGYHVSRPLKGHWYIYLYING